MEFEEIVVKPIGIVHSPRTEPIDDNWGSVVSKIELDSNQFDEQVLYGLSDFSHCEVVFFMNRVPVEKIEIAARHPRNRIDWPKVGIFAQRAKGRPNRIGISRCKILRVDGTMITVEALDAIDGTPIIDIKPYMEEFAPIGAVHQPDWSREVMAKYFR